jgi:hypothetical protein
MGDIQRIMTNKRRRGSQSQAAIQASLFLVQDRAASTQVEFEHLAPGWEYLISDTPVRLLLRDELIRQADALGEGTTSVRQALDYLKDLIDTVVMVTR